MTAPSDHWSLADVKAWLRTKWLDGKATECPACTQNVKLQPTPFPASAARMLIDMWRTKGRDWYYTPGFGEAGGDPIKARHWGLIEPMPDVVRDDGSSRTGMWRLTLNGVRFVNREISIPFRANLFNGHCYGYSEDRVMIQDRVGKGFDYRELMGLTNARQ